VLALANKPFISERTWNEDEEERVDALKPPQIAILRNQRVKQASKCGFQEIESGRKSKEIRQPERQAREGGSCKTKNRRPQNYRLKSSDSGFSNLERAAARIIDLSTGKTASREVLVVRG